MTTQFNENDTESKWKTKGKRGETSRSGES